MTKSIEMTGICKRFGDVQSLDNARFDLNEGEIHAILGENGAGKSTLMNVLSGIYQPDMGEIKIFEEVAKVSSPRDSIRLGIGMIHQHFKLFNNMSVSENIIAGFHNEMFVNIKEINKKVLDLSKKYSLEIDPESKIKNLSVAKKQRVEILKVLYRGARILILDEPTTVLTPQESEKLFSILRTMAADGKSIIIITHKMSEVMSISDRVTIMRKGEYIDTYNTSDVDARILTNAMVGKETELELNCPEYLEKEIVLSIDGLSVSDMDTGESIKDISFVLNKGEILGVAGVSGNGQKTLCESICGLLPIKSGEIIYNNEDITGLNPREIMNKGISLSFVPEDRLGMGLVSTMDIIENVLLKQYHKQPGIFISRKNSQEMAQSLVDKLNIDTPSVNHPVRLLSGGNIQKVLLGREIENNPQVIITAYPSRGLDIGSSHLVYDLLNEQKMKGVGIIFVAEDIDTIMGLSDRIIVICDGKITGVLENRDEFDKQLIGEYMSIS